nr:hypothetical protein [Tanacetum cinerariifolium]
QDHRIGKDEDDNDQEDDDNTDHDDDSERTDSDDDGDDFVHPKFLTHDDEASTDDEDNDDSYDVSVTTTAEPPLFSATTLPPSSTPIIPHLQQTPVPSPANVPSSSLQDLPNFGSLFGFDHRLKTLEVNFSKFMQTNQFAEVISSLLEEPMHTTKYIKGPTHQEFNTGATEDQPVEEAL